MISKSQTNTQRVAWDTKMSSKPWSDNGMSQNVKTMPKSLLEILVLIPLLHWENPFDCTPPFSTLHVQSHPKTRLQAVNLRVLNRCQWSQLSICATYGTWSCKKPLLECGQLNWARCLGTTNMMYWFSAAGRPENRASVVTRPLLRPWFKPLVNWNR